MLRNPFTEFELAGLLAEVHEEFGDLVRVHAGSGHLDGACPVEIVVTQIERQLLYHCLLKGRVVVRHIVVSREDASLSGILRHQVEVVLAHIVLILDHLLIDE